jgi:hypothetical protein
MNDGLIQLRVERMVHNPGNWLYAGTYGGASSRWSLQTGIEDEASAPVGTFALAAFPNPCIGASTISFSMQDAGTVSLAVYDVSGRLVTTLIDDYVGAGEHQVPFQASEQAVPSGVYFFRLSNGLETEVGRLVVLR